MNNYLNTFQKIAKNKIFHFVFSSYSTYFLQFVNSIFIAIYLGPHYLGIWGFCNLIVGYFSQLNFGIGLSANAIASVHKKNEKYVKMVLGTSISLFLLLSLIVIVLFIFNQIFDLGIGQKYNFLKYSYIILIVIISNYFSGLLSVTFRVYGKLNELIISRLLGPLLTMLILIFFKGESLLNALVLGLCFSSVITFLLFLVKSPFKIKPIINFRLIKKIQHKGWYLFIYNSSFYLIVLSTRSFVSGFYSVNEFGYFTFAFTLANAIFMLLESFSFLIYPKLLNRLATGSKEVISNIVNKIRDIYIVTSHLLVHIGIFIIPFFLKFIPKYENETSVFNMIALTLVLYTNSFGYSGLLIARNKEKQLGKIALSVLVFNIMLLFVFVKIFKVSYSFVILSTLISYIIYVFLIGFMARKHLGLSTAYKDIFVEIYPFRLIFPYVISLLITLLNLHNLFFAIPIFIFILLNGKQLFNLKNDIKNILFNPSIIDI